MNSHTDFGQKISGGLQSSHLALAPRKGNSTRELLVDGTRNHGLWKPDHSSRNPEFPAWKP